MPALAGSMTRRNKSKAAERVSAQSLSTRTSSGDGSARSSLGRAQKGMDAGPHRGDGMLGQFGQAFEAEFRHGFRSMAQQVAGQRLSGR